MPYYRHPKDVDIVADTDVYASHSTMQAAREGLNVKTETVTFIASEAERSDWHSRERSRFDDKSYLPVPWYVSSCEERRPEHVRYHYAHLSLKSPGLVAYTKNDEHGVNDRQTAVKPGKYLAEFYADQFNLEAIAQYVAKCSVTAQDFKLATTEEDIVAIFGNTNSGFTSCMQSKRSPEYDWDRAFQNGDRKHPCAVYGDSDLAVAYLGDIQTKVTARVVVWPEKKIINLRSDGTVYGDQTLLHILTAHGWTPDSIVGARIQRIKTSIGTIMPYVDNIDWGNPSECGKWVILDDAGHNRLTRLGCHNHDSGYGEQGVSDAIDHDDDEVIDDEYSARYTCEHCQDTYDYDQMSRGPLNYHHCDDCLASSQVCDKCDTRHWGESTEVGGDSWCDACVDHHTVECIHQIYVRGSIKTCGKIWIEVGEFDPTERAERISAHTTHLCRGCAEGKQSCVVCETLFDVTASQCPCGHSVRCSQTENLPLGPENRYVTHAQGFGDSTLYFEVSPTETIIVTRNGRRHWGGPHETDSQVAMGTWVEIPASVAHAMEHPF